MVLAHSALLVPVLGCAAAGAALALFRLPVDERTVRVLVAWIGLPALLLSAFAQAPVSLDALGRTLLGGAAALGGTALAAAIVLALLRLPAATVLPAVVHPAAALLGIPIVQFTHAGAVLVHALALAALVHASQAILGAWIATGRPALREILLAPTLWALALVALLAWSGLRLPGWATEVTGLLGTTAAPLLLLLLGMSLARGGIGNRGRGPGWGLGRGLAIGALRLGLGIGAGFLAATLMPVTGAGRTALVLCFAMPVAAGPVFGEASKGVAPEVGTAALATTVLALVFLPFILRLAVLV